MNSKNKIILAVVAVLAIAAIIALGIKNQMNHNSGDDENVIRLGAIMPLTGPLAFVGESSKEGLLLAVDIFNNSVNGKRIKVILEDGKGTVKDSISAYNNLMMQSPSILFCVASVTAKAVVTPSLDVLTILSTVSDSTIAEKNQNVFNITVNSQQELQAMCHFWESKSIKKVGLIYQKDELGLEIKETIHEICLQHGINIIGEEEISTAESILSATTRTKDTFPEAVFVGATGSNAAMTVKRLVENNFKGIICCLKGFNSPSVLKQAGEAANGVYLCYTNYDMDDESQSNELKQFRDLFLKKYNHVPDALATDSFCVINLALKKIDSAGFNFEEAKKLLLETNNEPSVLGNLSCTSKRFFIFPIGVGIIREGHINKVN